jgi:hypothetical protein
MLTLWPLYCLERTSVPTGYEAGIYINTQINLTYKTFHRRQESDLLADSIALYTAQANINMVDEFRHPVIHTTEP